jgi:N-glycosylase/DNA lyase
VRLLRLDRRVPFDLGITLCCGQVFRWELRSGWWYGVVGGRVWKVRQVDHVLEFENAEENEMLEYFGLQDDLPRILKEIAKDPYARKAVEEFRGLRILRQEPWECLVSFICATYKGVPAIKRMLDQLSTGFGEQIIFEGREFYAFPTMERLARASMSTLTKCGLGYRTRYVKETAKIVRKHDFNLGSLRGMRYNEARKELLKLPGVGPKVADCVLLFSLGKTKAFPVDVWMRRVILRHYAKHLPQGFIRRISEEKSLSNTEYARLSLFGRNYFGKYAGYAQEYLYHCERMQ